METTEHLEGLSIHTGSLFDDFLEEVGIHDEVKALAIRKVLAWQMEGSQSAAQHRAELERTLVTGRGKRSTSTG
jgi:hypothetical protein